MLHKAWNSKRKMPYYFPRSSIKFQGHTVQNITYFTQIGSFRTIGRSQLPNPSDLPCYVNEHIKYTYIIITMQYAVRYLLSGFIYTVFCWKGDKPFSEPVLIYHQYKCFQWKSLSWFYVGMMCGVTFQGHYVDGLVQECSISNVLEILQSCSKPSMYPQISGTVVLVSFSVICSCLRH